VQYRAVLISNGNIYILFPRFRFHVHVRLLLLFNCSNYFRLASFHHTPHLNSFSPEVHYNYLALYSDDFYFFAGHPFRSYSFIILRPVPCFPPHFDYFHAYLCIFGAGLPRRSAMTGLRDRCVYADIWRASNLYTTLVRQMTAPQLLCANHCIFCFSLF